ncbi:MAG: hypothetical protein K8R88_04435 [Armatimonadetes bacterium]|nr:hypothetical protein [Armatimonadota bacterium]
MKLFFIADNFVMADEQFPKGIVAGVAVGVVALVLLSVSVPKSKTTLGEDSHSHSHESDSHEKISAPLGPEYNEFNKNDEHHHDEHDHDGHHHDEGGHGSTEMPAKLDSDVAASVFSSPSGQYTKADIALNGIQTPEEKFKAIRSSHDMHPKPGSAICPITSTKANPAFSWWVGGKKYIFCCPPCIEEWVVKAKASKVPFAPPESFIAK